MEKQSLSWVGRCTLINSVVQAIPNYTMSSFKILAKTVISWILWLEDFGGNQRKMRAGSLPGKHGKSFADQNVWELSGSREQKM